MTEALGKKYELLKTGEREFEGLFRIRALRDFGTVKKGDIGGFVESEDNLSHEGNCWIADDALVESFARVCNNALVCGQAMIGGRTVVADEAYIGGSVTFGELARIGGNIRMTSAPTGLLGEPFSFQNNSPKPTDPQP